MRVVSEAVRKSAVLIEALPYIKLFRDRTIVVKLGGSAQEERDVLLRVFADIDFMVSVGMRPVVVYGGGKRISAAMEEAGLRPRFVQGQRVTDEAAMEVVTRVLLDEVGPWLVEIMARAGGRAALLNGRDGRFLTARQKRLAGDPDLDLGFVGEPAGVDAAQLDALLRAGTVPLVAPVAAGGDRPGVLYNVNGDTASAFLARALGAAKIVFLSDTPGIYRSLGDEETLLSTVGRADVDALIERGVIHGGMIPKVQAAVAALEGGVGKAHIVSGYQPHALLLEIFTDQGVGTEIVHNS